MSASLRGVRGNRGGNRGRGNASAQQEQEHSSLSDDIQMNPPEPAQNPLQDPQGLNPNIPQPLQEENQQDEQNEANPQGEVPQSPQSQASQYLSALRNSNLFSQGNVNQEHGSSNSSSINHQLISQVMRGNQEASEIRIRDGQRLDQVNRAVTSGRIPAASSGLAKSITFFAKSMLGMEKKRSKFIPAPPTPEEYELFANHRNEIQQAINQFVNNSIAKAKESQPNLDSFSERKIRAAAIREAKKKLPEVPYKREPANTSNCRYFASLWLAHAHRSLARSGIPRCTYDWNDNHDSPWNSTIIEVFLDSWGLSHQNSTSQHFRIEASLNTPENQIAILQRWFDNTSSEWVTAEHLREVNKDNPNFRAPVRATSNAAKIRNQKKSRRADTAMKVFPRDQYTEALVVYSVDGLMSDAEGEDGKKESARSVEWRHNNIKILNNLLDEAYIQLGSTPRMKRDRRATIANSKHPELPESSHENAHENIPKEIPKNWVKPEYISKLTAIEIMGLKFKSDLNLAPAIDFLRTKVERPTSASAPVASGSR